MISASESRAGTRSDLNFTVRLVRTPEQLARAVGVRSSAYGRHVPELGRLLKAKEESDIHPASVVFLAEAKADGSPIGTLRILTNRSEALPLERHIALPDYLSRDTIAYVERLAVLPRADASTAKTALFKALHRYCLATQIRWMVVGARKALERQYLSLGFVDVFPDQPPALLPQISPNPLRILNFDSLAAERRWHEVQHPLYRFMFLDHHPDIQVFSSISSSWATPRRERMGISAIASAGHAVDLPLHLPFV